MPEDIEKQIGEMISNPEQEPIEVPEVEEVEEPIEGEPPQEPEESEKTEEPVEPEESEELEESPAEEPEESEELVEEEPTDEVKTLRHQINEMSKVLAKHGMTIESGEVKPQEPTEESEEPSKPPEVIDFLTEEELSALEDDPKRLNSILTKVYQRATEDVLRQIPQIVNKTASRQITLREKVRDFYQDNPDLLEHRDFVGYIATQVESSNPDWNIDQVFEETAKTARTNLGLKSKAQRVEAQRRAGAPTGEQGAAFPRKPRGQRGGVQDTRTKQQKQIDEVIDL